MSIRDGAVITAPMVDGRPPRVGGSPPQALAKLILIETEETRLRNPMFE
jgi:hypothetical protein